jgi:hypothetical protein
VKLRWSPVRLWYLSCQRDLYQVCQGSPFHTCVMDYCETKAVTVGIRLFFWFTYDAHEFFLVISHVSSVTSKSLPTA